MKKRFLDFLTDENNNSYFVENGVVKKNAQNIPIPNAPDGWRDHQIKVARNTTYFGLFRTFSLPLKFVKEAAQIVRERLYKYGIEDAIYYYKLKLNETTGRHSLMYKGELDLTTSKDILTSCDVVTIDGGINKFLKANENVTYEIELSGEGVIDVLLDTCKLEQSGLYLKTGDTANFSHIIAIDLISSESKNTINSKSQEYQQVNNDADIYNSNFYFNKTTSDSTFNIEFNIEFNVRIDDNHQLYVINGIALVLFGYDDSNNQAFTPVILASSLVIADYPNYHQKLFSGTRTLNIAKNVRLYFVMMTTHNGNLEYYDQSNTSVDFNYFENPDLNSNKYYFKIGYSFASNPTICKAISAIELGNRLVKKMAGDNSYYLFSSELLNSSIYLTSGDAIRGFSNSKIKTSFKDFFTSFNRNLCLGLSTKDKTIFIERRDIFFDQSTMIYDLGEVKNVEIKPIPYLLFKKIKVGYADQSYDDLNGRKEFNNTLEFTSPLSKSTKELDLTAPYRADMYGVTFAQINLDGKTTQDSSSDNSVFMLDIDTSTYPEDVVFSADPNKSFGVTDAEIPVTKISVTNAFELSSNKIEITYKGKPQTIALTSIFKFENTNYEAIIYLNGVAISSSINNNIDATLTTTFYINTGDVIKFKAVSHNAQNLYLLTFTATFTLSEASKKVLYRFLNQNTVVSGVPFPNKAFNVRLSPKRCLLRHGAFIRGILQPYNNKELTYQTTTKNTIVTNIGGNVIDEKESVLIGNLDKNYFLPFYVQFETVVPETLFQLIADNGLTGYFPFTYKGNVFKGFVMDASQKPGDDESQTFTLLLTADNNLNKLINA